MPGNRPHYGRWPQHDFTSLKKLRPQSVTSRIQPGSDVIVCAEMDEQWGYVGAKELLNASRSHWLVESMHWMLDTAFGEDACRKRAEERAENFARIRQMCLNMLKSETTLKASIKHKRAMCAMDPEYLLKVLGSLYLRECS